MPISTRTRITVTRRFPTYDFAFRTPLSVADASRRLEDLVGDQPRPKGFVFGDPRVDGVVSGSTFEIRRRQAALVSGVAPYAEGYFVPAAQGADVVVRVRISSSWWAFDALMLLVALMQRDLALIVLVVPVLLFLSIGPVWWEAGGIARLLTRHLCDEGGLQ